MGAMASQITSLTIVHSTVYSDADQRKHQSSASLAFVRGIHRGPVNSPHKWPVTEKMFPFHDVIMSYTLLLPCIYTTAREGNRHTLKAILALPNSSILLDDQTLSDMQTKQPLTHFGWIPNCYYQTKRLSGKSWTRFCGDQLSVIPLIARFMGSTLGSSEADRTQVGPMLAPWTLLSETTSYCALIYPMTALMAWFSLIITETTRICVECADLRLLSALQNLYQCMLSTDFIIYLVYIDLSRWSYSLARRVSVHFQTV